ncbi:MAG: adenylate kinase [Thermomicrobiales bacterium]
MTEAAPAARDPWRSLAGCRRIVVVGTTSSGKTTLAGRLALLLDYPHIELDALHWEPHWTPAAPERFRERATAATAAAQWVADGNYSVVRDIVWARADTAIWLDYPLAVNFWRLTRRSLVRGTRRVELWNGNRESLREQFLSRDSLFLWAVQSHARKRREYPALLARPEYAHLAVVHLRSPRATRRWLGRVAGRKSKVESRSL